MLKNLLVQIILNIYNVVDGTVGHQIEMHIFGKLFIYFSGQKININFRRGQE